MDPLNDPLDARSTRSRTILIVLGVFLVFVPVLIFIYPRLLPHTQAPVETITTIVPVEHQYKKGIHTYVGTLQVPTPCHTISGQAIVTAGSPEQVEVRLEVTPGSGACAQVVSEKKFKVSFEADPSPDVREFINSTPVLFQATEAPASVDLSTEEI